MNGPGGTGGSRQERRRRRNPSAQGCAAGLQQSPRRRRSARRPADTVRICPAGGQRTRGRPHWNSGARKARKEGTAQAGAYRPPRREGAVQAEREPDGAVSGEQGDPEPPKAQSQPGNRGCAAGRASTARCRRRSRNDLVCAPARKGLQESSTEEQTPEAGLSTSASDPKGAEEAQICAMAAGRSRHAVSGGPSCPGTPGTAPLPLRTLRLAIALRAFGNTLSASPTRVSPWSFRAGPAGLRLRSRMLPGFCRGGGGDRGVRRGLCFSVSLVPSPSAENRGGTAVGGSVSRWLGESRRVRACDRV